MIVWILAVGCVPVVVVAGLLCVRRRFVIVHVTGQSMLPGLLPGDRVLVRRGTAGRLGLGTVVVLRFPRSGSACVVGPLADPAGTRWAIKRVAALPGDPVPESVRPAVHGASIVPAGELVLLGDNPAGIDSRRWGFVPASDLLGCVVSRLGPSAGGLTGAR